MYLTQSKLVKYSLLKIGYKGSENFNTNQIKLKIMITILSFSAKKGNEKMYSEVLYDLTTKEAIYLHFWTLGNKVEKKEYKSIVIPTCHYQADLKYAIENDYEIIINPEI